MQYFNFNGDLYTINTPVISAGSPGLRYGSGLFETMKLFDGNLIFAKEHFARLWAGIKLLQLSIPPGFMPGNLVEQIHALASSNKMDNARIRFAIYQNTNGYFDYIIEASTLPVLKDFNEAGINLGIFPNGKKVCDNYSHLKHNNFLVYHLGKKYAETDGFDDVVILNDKGNISDTSKANIFMVKDEVIFTPTLKEGCIAGIIRAKVLDLLRINKYKVLETILTTDDLLKADEIFITNSIIDMQWIRNFMGATKVNQFCKKLYGELLLAE